MMNMNFPMDPAAIYAMQMGGYGQHPHPAMHHQFPQHMYNNQQQPYSQHHYNGGGAHHTSQAGSPTPIMNQSLPTLPKPVPIDALRGRIVDLAREDTGCRMLLRILEAPTTSDVLTMFEEIAASNSIGALMQGRHSNFLLQRLFEVCNPSQVTSMLSQLLPDVAHMARNAKGTYAIRKVVDNVTTPQQARLVVQGLMMDPMGSVTDPNGSMVMRRIMKKVHANEWGSDILRPVIAFVGENMGLIGRNQAGCCVVQRLLDAVDNRVKAEIICTVLTLCNDLVCDPYGNYIVQYVLDLNKEYICVQLAAQFLKELRRLASNKYSSNVVEKCLATAPPDVRDIMILEMCVGDTAACLIQDEYGNYVVQTALKLATPQQFQILREAIHPFIATMGIEHVRKRVEQRLKEGPTTPATVTSPMAENDIAANTAFNFVALVSLEALPLHMQRYVSVSA